MSSRAQNTNCSSCGRAGVIRTQGRQQPVDGISVTRHPRRYASSTASLLELSLLGLAVRKDGLHEPEAGLLDRLLGIVLLLGRRLVLGLQALEQLLEVTPSCWGRH